MPFAGPPGPPPTFLESLLPLYHATFHPAGAAVAQIVTLPGQVLVSLALVLVAAWRSRQGRWLAAWLAGTAVEVFVRHVLTRPPVYRHGVHLAGFDSSWPSGHALRCSIVACALAAAWPRLRAPLLLWLAACAVLLELAGFHTPTDVLGGLLLAAVAVGSSSGLLGRRSPRGAALGGGRAGAG